MADALLSGQADDRPRAVACRAVGSRRRAAGERRELQALPTHEVLKGPMAGEAANPWREASERLTAITTGLPLQIVGNEGGSTPRIGLSIRTFAQASQD